MEEELQNAKMMNLKFENELQKSKAQIGELSKDAIDSAQEIEQQKQDLALL